MLREAILILQVAPLGPFQAKTEVTEPI